MNDFNDKTNIELGMRMSVLAVVTGFQGEYVIVRWTNSELGETVEYHAHRDDVTPLAGWL